jgi:hypothetical protein
MNLNGLTRRSIAGGRDKFLKGDVIIRIVIANLWPTLAVAVAIGRVWSGGGIFLFSFGAGSGIPAGLIIGWSPLVS